MARSTSSRGGRPTAIAWPSFRPHRPDTSCSTSPTFATASTRGAASRDAGSAQRRRPLLLQPIRSRDQPGVDARRQGLSSSRTARSPTAPATSCACRSTAPATPRVVQHEETSWHARPDVSPDGTRHRLQQLSRPAMAAALAAAGRWRLSLSAHLRRLRQHQPALVAGRPDDRVHLQPLRQHRALAGRRVLGRAASAARSRSAAIRQPHRELNLRVVDEAGHPIAGARSAIVDSRTASYAPDEAWMHADDMLVPERQPVETRYFHSAGRSRGHCAARPAHHHRQPRPRLRGRARSRKTRGSPLGSARAR